MTKAIHLALTAFLSMSVGFSGAATSNSEPEGLDDLEKVKGGLFKQCLISPDAADSEEPWSDVGEWARLAAADLLQELGKL